MEASDEVPVWDLRGAADAPSMAGDLTPLMPAYVQVCSEVATYNDLVKRQQTERDDMRIRVARGFLCTTEYNIARILARVVVGNGVGYAYAILLCDTISEFYERAAVREPGWRAEDIEECNKYSVAPSATHIAQHMIRWAYNGALSVVSILKP